jgi:hypothetical protein
MDTNSPATSSSGPRSEAVPQVHNSAIDEAAALQGGCGQVHLPSGRMCTLRNGHARSCEFSPPDEVDAVLAEHKAAGHW